MTIEKLRKDYEAAEAARVKLDAEYEEKRVALKDKYVDRLSEAGQKAADAQKALCDAEAAAALVGRPDAEAVAKTLGLTLPAED